MQGQPMHRDIDIHHALEAELYRLRLLRDLRDPDYRSELEDALLDDMEAVWYRLSDEDRRLLEAERAARRTIDLPSPVPTSDLPAVDVDEDGQVRLGLPPRIVVRAS